MGKYITRSVWILGYITVKYRGKYISFKALCLNIWGNQEISEGGYRTFSDKRTFTAYHYGAFYHIFHFSSFFLPVRPFFLTLFCLLLLQDFLLHFLFHYNLLFLLVLLFSFLSFTLPLFLFPFHHHHRLDPYIPSWSLPVNPTNTKRGKNTHKNKGNDSSISPNTSLSPVTPLNFTRIEKLPGENWYKKNRENVGD